MDKNQKDGNNNYILNPFSKLYSNRTKEGVSYEKYLSAKNPNISNNSSQNIINNSITTSQKQNGNFMMNMNPLYFNMLRYNFFKNTIPPRNDQNINNRINSLLLDFNDELKEEYEKEENNIDNKNIENKNNNYNFTPLIKKLESIEDERFAKSRFLQFIKDINSKKIIINEEKNIIEENPNFKNDSPNEKPIEESNSNELEELLKEAKKYMNYSREDLAINILETIFDNSLIKDEKNKQYLIKAYTYIIICYLNLNEDLLGISFIIDLLNLIKEKSDEKNVSYNKQYLEKDFIDKINRRDFDIWKKEEYDNYENNKTKIKKETENYIKSIIMANKKEEYNETLLLLYGLILYLNENYIETEAAFKLLIILNDQNYFYLNILGVINANQEKYEDAEKYYRKALEINGQYPKCLINYGVLLSNQGKIKESCKNIISALKIFEDIPEGWNKLLSNVIELDKDELICEINDRNLINIENCLLGKK